MNVNDSTVPAGSAPVESLTTEVCVVGGGMAGICAAIAAARHGARVVLLQDRAVLGGNASSEVRMWICGAHGKDNKETGILEEIQLENCYRNPRLNYSVWDTVLYEKVRFQDGIDLRLSCAVVDVAIEGDRLTEVRAWHLTRQCWIAVRATQFIDCSGDSILRLSGASTRWGRESRDDYGEDLAPAVADRSTMGNSILLQLREIDPADHVPFIAPAWARSISTAELADHRGASPTGHNFWWLELGGTEDTIGDADAIRDRLLALAYGVWAAIKNNPDGSGERWELEWIGALPGKRENIRYLGDHVLTQQDIQSGGRFDDLVAYGGWTMDDHPPGGFDHDGQPTHHHHAPSPYGIAWRCLYSCDRSNLLCAGRNISATHMALSSTRVMATCSLLGQAVGTGAALAVRHACSPRAVGERHLSELQALLADDDQYLPGRARELAPLMEGARFDASEGDPAPLLDGVDRHLGETAHAWSATDGATVTLTFPETRRLERLRLVLDSQLHRLKRMPCSWPKGGNHAAMPAPLLRNFRVQLHTSDGDWRTVASVTDNRRRLVQLPLSASSDGLRLCCDASWGGEYLRIFSLDCGAPRADTPLRTIPWPADGGRMKGAGA